MRRAVRIVVPILVLLAGWSLVLVLYLRSRETSRAIALNAAVRDGDVAGARRLLDKGTDPDARDPQGLVAIPSWGIGYRPLHWAAERGDVQAAQLLVTYGADPDAPDDYGATPLHQAALHRQPEFAAFMLTQG